VDACRVAVASITKKQLQGNETGVLTLRQPFLNCGHLQRFRGVVGVKGAIHLDFSKRAKEPVMVGSGQNPGSSLSEWIKEIENEGQEARVTPQEEKAPEPPDDEPDKNDQSGRGLSSSR
jgi:hypothetical protein